MELELVGNCGCYCNETSCDNCFCLICLAIVVVVLIVIAFIGYLAFSKYLATKLKMAKDERDFKKEEFDKKQAWEKYLDDKLTDRKREDLELRIKEFKEITYPSAVLSKVDNKKMTTDDVASNVKELTNKVKIIEKELIKDKK